MAPGGARLVPDYRILASRVDGREPTDAARVRLMGGSARGGLRPQNKRAAAAAPTAAAATTQMRGPRPPVATTQNT